MAANLDIPLIFYGEMPGEYGEKISHKTSSFAVPGSNSESDGYKLDPVSGTDLRDVQLGGKAVGEYLEDGILESYLHTFGRFFNIFECPLVRCRCLTRKLLWTFS